MLMLGIETSCDETSVALVDDARRILAQITRSQLDEHISFGGVVPEIAARAHLQYLPRMVAEVMAQTKTDWTDVTGIAATVGPGLIGGLLVGATYGRSLALARGIPFHPVNHLEGHALTARLTDDVQFPYLLLLVSGGHTALLDVRGVGDYEMLGETRDDAAGECFDKCAKLLGLGWPGGPALEKLAATATGKFKFELPRPMLGHASADFSFSGLKTAVRQIARSENFTDAMRADLAAAVQTAIADTLADRTAQAIKISGPKLTALVVAGGVAANQAIRQRLLQLAQKN
ncbi:MAG TPA: tRNA (adenosine(37)-N6)-threonylcarbamoyltransferase complex transferase subunit TsaD, partial [Rhodospirillaceae bacterium]|nr:tRNA (adenosine(37)-N6)-threonylcarbamoyltransferase complex transferase subunit TsaD [Rhodospirillaceae bacterium]